MERLVETAETLSKLLENESNNDRNFCNDVGMLLEQYSWEMHKMANDLRELQAWLGV